MADDESMSVEKRRAPQLVLPGKLPHPPCNPDGTPDSSLIYPSLIDHASTSASFETVGRRPHHYYVRWNHNLDRDLLCVPLNFERAGAAYLPLAVRTAAPGDRADRRRTQ